MDTEERLNRMEQRLTVMEGLVRQLLAQVPIRRTSERRDAGTAGRQENPGEQPGGPTVGRPASTAARPRATIAVDSEQWFGQRGLLAVGVIFLILAAGYLLKLSFERGWVSPGARCLGGAIAGLMVGGLGHGLHRKGLAT
jgi:uncharacterized membrane protein